MKHRRISTDLDFAYRQFASGIAELLAAARRQAARSVNAILTATYWETGRRIVEFEQRGKKRAGYGEVLLERLAIFLIGKLGRGFSRQNLQQMRQFYLAHPADEIRQTVSGEFTLTTLARAFPLSWSHYVRLMGVKRDTARHFYETEALRGGWSVRQLDRQVQSMFYERTALSRDKAAMLKKGAKLNTEDAVTPEEEIKDPYILEFLDLKDEYSESEMEEALIRHLETFLLELGGDFTFVARQKRLRVGSEWYRVDLVFYHRRLRCLVLIDLKIGKFTHADAGQMHLYLNYAREHWTHRNENPPVGLILCAEKDHAVAHYALENLPNKVLASEYRTTLPNEKDIAREIKRTRLVLDAGRLDKDRLGS
jgi:predicted nuclease of restriction endonuclease-like (RecB) superfamily